MDLRKILFVLIIATLSVSDQIDEEDYTTSISRKERFLLATLKFQNERCQIGANTDVGVCKSWKECWLRGGRSTGSCPLGHGVCCLITNTCGAVTSERVSYFVQPNVFQPSCTLRVNVYDRRVTQLRLDFEKFSLAPPTRPNYNPNPPLNQFPAYFCFNDSFTVTSSSIGVGGNLGFINLCGENSGQHIYVPVNATTGSASVELAFNLADRANFTGLGQPQWKIRITQIDCCAPDTRDLCAPAGCLQYYPARSGTFESFNYNNGLGPYQGLLNYAICFKKYDGVCSNRYSSTSFNLPANNLLIPYGSACNWATTDTAIPNSRDYLFIPDGQFANGGNASLYCGDSLQTSAVTSNAPGPMFVFFRTDATSNDVALGLERGFRIQYGQSGTGCYTTSFYTGLGR